MKAKVSLICTLFLFLSAVAIGQKKVIPKSIIQRSALISKYHDSKELSSMPKKELLELCIERASVITKTLLDDQEEGTTTYLELTTNFQRKILPYADKNRLIAAILFYENILKSLHEFEEN
ncbi:MAG: hypothetical protein RL074_1112 [Bacteroidota bacterium]